MSKLYNKRLPIHLTDEKKRIQSNSKLSILNISTLFFVLFFMIFHTAKAQKPCVGQIVQAQVHVTPAKDTLVCSNTSLTYTAHTINAGTSPLVKWYISGVHLEKDTGLSITFKAVSSGYVCALVIARDLNSYSSYCLSPTPIVGNCAVVTVQSVPMPTVVKSVDCITKLVKAKVSSPTTGVIYSFDGAPFSSNNCKTYSTNGTHSIVLKSTSSLGCLSDISYFNTEVPKDFSLTTNVTVPICDMPIGQIDITSPLTPGFLYSFDNGFTYGSSTSFKAAAGNYVVSAKSGLGCTISANVNVPAVKFAGTTPQITVLGSMLMASDGRNWQWYLNGQPIVGATQQMYVPLTYGDYTVRITNNNGCVATSGITHTQTDYDNYCPAIHKNFGAACDDGDPNTINDRVRNNCKCRGDLYSPDMTVQCPNNMVILSTDYYGTVVNWDVKFATNCTAGTENWVDVVQTSGYYNGYPFPPNTLNPIEYVGTDLCGNKSSCSFLLTLTPYYSRAVTNLNTKTVSVHIPVVVESIFPNPTEDDLHMKVFSLDKREIGFQFYNSLGSILKTEKRLLDKGANEIIFDTSGWQGGVYYVVPQTLFEHDIPTKFVKF